jgi:hypothetical protein
VPGNTSGKDCWSIHDTRGVARGVDTESPRASQVLPTGRGAVRTARARSRDGAERRCFRGVECRRTARPRSCGEAVGRSVRPIRARPGHCAQADRPSDRSVAVTLTASQLVGSAPLAAATGIYAGAQGTNDPPVPATRRTVSAGTARDVFAAAGIHGLTVLTHRVHGSVFRFPGPRAPTRAIAAKLARGEPVPT